MFLYLRRFGPLERVCTSLRRGKPTVAHRGQSTVAHRGQTHYWKRCKYKTGSGLNPLLYNQVTVMQHAKHFTGLTRGVCVCVSVPPKLCTYAESDWFVKKSVFKLMSVHTSGEKNAVIIWLFERKPYRWHQCIIGNIVVDHDVLLYMGCILSIVHTTYVFFAGCFRVELAGWGS